MASTAVRMAFISAGLLLAACSRPESQESAAPAAPAAASTVFEIMNATIIPKSNLIWEQSGNLYDDDGKLDAKRLTDQQWKDVEDAGNAMGSAARTLAAATALKVAPAGAKIQGEGTEGAATAAEVQAAMDADPKGFSDHFTQLAAISDEIAAAAKARDAMKTDDAQGRLTDVCGACHAKFWYPKQAAQ